MCWAQSSRNLDTVPPDYEDSGSACGRVMTEARLTSLSSPSRITMKKNNTDHRGATGISATAAGYATNAKPGPDNACNNNKLYSSHIMKIEPLAHIVCNSNLYSSFLRLMTPVIA